MHSTIPTPPTFFVNQIPVYGDLILAPMAGFSDQPFRSLCRAMGSAMSYTEFINALDVLHGHPLLHRKTAFLEQERPVVFQVFDCDPVRLLEAVRKLREHNPDIFDVNMGCSVRRVSGRGAGAGLLREPSNVANVIDVLCRGQDLPVTAKIRLGWDGGSRNYREIARAIEENGGALIAVHGRTRMQGYSGCADWDAIAEIKQAVSIPVVANGDVLRIEDIQRIKEHTACDAVMIGRAAIGNPWIFARLDREAVSAEQVRKTVLHHLQSMLTFYGETQGMVLFRKHASRYLQPVGLTPEQRSELFSSEQPAEFLKMLDTLQL